MNPQLVSEWLEPLSLAERAKVLNLVSFMLTIRARDYGLPDSPVQGEEAAIKRLLGINELQHKLLSQVAHYMDGDDSKAYPVSVFSKILFEQAAYYNTVGALNAAFKSARGFITPTAA
ncbi:MAG: hypothetical protein WB679_04015 [Terracidiphilus sp.]